MNKDKEVISYWSNGTLRIKKFNSMDKLLDFVTRKGITQYYWCGYCFMKI